MNTYRSMYRCHIARQLGSKEIDEINRSDIKLAIASLAPQTAAMTLAVIKVLFREALELGLIEKSPVHGIKGPSIVVSPRKFLTWEEIEAAYFGKYQKQIHFLALHGLRWSEAVAIDAGADIRGGRIYISRSIHGPTKSQAGIRVVPLVSEFSPLPKTPAALRKVLTPYGVTIHSLRHTYAYILKRQGVHVTTAQRLLGHSDPKITLSIYTQVLDREIDEVGSELQAMLLDRKARPSLTQL
jgi:integrase